MTINPPDPHCEAVQDELAELALGTLSGLERSVVLTHVEGCPSCRAEVNRLSAVADAILTLAPEVEPTAGFETRLFERMGVSDRRRWSLPRRHVQRLALAGGALLGALGLGLGLALTSGGGVPATDTTAISANLTADHTSRGEVYLAPGHPGWLLMSVDHAQVTGLVTCRLTTARGETISVGTFWLASGSGTWAYQLPVPADQVKRAWVTTSDGQVVASAVLNT
jgi:predicted anti-sigma-YlaC factor YlaD